MRFILASAALAALTTTPALATNCSGTIAGKLIGTIGYYDGPMEVVKASAKQLEATIGKSVIVSKLSTGCARITVRAANPSASISTNGS
jgi:hypothetical protein